LSKTTFLFWNINRKPLAEAVAELAQERGIDIVMLAECAIDPTAALWALNRHSSEFRFSSSASHAMSIFTRFSSELLTPAFESNRITIRRLELPDRLKLLLVGVHLPSKLHLSEASQAFECTNLANRIIGEEDRVNHRRTVVVGDFNMNPFEPGMIAGTGLNSVMSRNVAERGQRTIQGGDYRFFYNPMWSHFGDARSSTAGSYFHDNGQHVNYFWNMFDQLLLRPELAQHFDPNSLAIVTSVRRQSLVRENGRPDGSGFSDHLPIVFELEF
jgi:hypothetical protein